MTPSCPIPDSAAFVPASRDGIDLAARYVVETNDGVYEEWSGALLYIRMRPEFVHGRAEWMARIET